MAKQCGAQVAIVGLPQDSHRLELASKHYGCEVIIGDAKPWALERDGLGCDGVIDAAGASITLKIALDIVRPADWISKVGWVPAAARLQYGSARAEEHHAARQLQPQLAHLGTRHRFAQQRTVRREAHHRRRLARDRMTRGL